MNKAPSHDNIPNKFLRGTAEELSHILAVIQHSKYKRNSTPARKVLHKNGHKENIYKYMPISVIPNIYIFRKSITRKNSQKLDECKTRA